MGAGEPMLVNLRIARLTLRHVRRALPIWSLAAVAAAAAAPVLLGALDGNDDLGLAFVVGALIGGSGLGLICEDQAAVVLASSPTPLLARRAVRLAVGVALISIGWAAAGTVSIIVSDGAGFGIQGFGAQWWAVAFASGGTAAAVATGMSRSMSESAVGMPALAAAVLAMLTSSALEQRWPTFPTIAAPTVDKLWWLFGGVAWTVAWWCSRDPAKRSQLGGSPLWRRARSAAYASHGEGQS